MQKVVCALACVVATTTGAVGTFADPLRMPGDGPMPQRTSIPERRGLREDVFIAPGPPRPPTPVAHPYPETATVGKQTAGTWTCTGGAVDKVTIKLAVDNAWIEWTIAGGAGTTVQYRTYDGIAKQWTMIELTSAGKSRTLTSLGADAPSARPKAERGSDHDLWTWSEGDHRELETFTKDKLELSGERKHGDKWAKNYSAACSRKK